MRKLPSSTMTVGALPGFSQRRRIVRVAVPRRNSSAISRRRPPPTDEEVLHHRILHRVTDDEQRYQVKRLHLAHFAFAGQAHPQEQCSVDHQRAEGDFAYVSQIPSPENIVNPS